LWSFCDERRDGFVGEVLAVVEVYLEDVAAVHGECDDAPVGQLGAAVQLQALQMSTALGDSFQRFV
jgi:hypothetical protein